MKRDSLSEQNMTITQKTSSSYNSGKYRADIDGLRAVAVVAVIIFHAFPRWFSGGFVGVDIFFVISGYLISGILYRELESGTFSFSGFYARRAKRIFPALLIVLTTTCLFGWYVLTPDEFAQLGKHGAAGAGFVANFAMWSEVGYFDNASDTKALLHLWSLGIEEQFYIIWPLLLVFLYKRKFFIWQLAAVLAVFSFVLNVYFIDTHADAVFYMPVTRFWELLAGGLLAYFHTRTSPRLQYAVSPQVGQILSVLGLAGLLAAFGLIDESMPFPGWWALLPVVSAILLIAAGSDSVINRYFLSNRLARWIGMISYPAYLWHWPLLAFGKILFGNLTKEARIALIMVTFILAHCTYVYVEKKIRFGRVPDLPGQKKGSLLVPKLYVVLVAAVAVNLTIAAGILSARSTSRDFDSLLTAQSDWAYPPQSFSKLSKGMAHFYTRGPESKSYTVFIGDSIVEQYAPRVDFLLNSRDSGTYRSVIFATGPGCPPIPNVVHRARHSHPACAATAMAAYELAHKSNVEAVVIGGNWDNYLSPKNEALAYLDGTRLIPYTEAGAVEAALASLANEIELLSKSKQVYILLNSPKGPGFSPKSMLTGSRWTTLGKNTHREGASIEAFISEYVPIRAKLEMIADRYGAKIIDPISTLCKGGTCPTVSVDGDPLFMDEEHMRPFYVREYAVFIDEVLRANELKSKTTLGAAF